MNTYIFVVDLVQKHRSHVTREIEVHKESNLYDLAKVIVAAYGFDFDHAFGFFSRMGEDYFHSERKYELFADMEELAAEHPESKSVQRTKVSEVWKSPGDRMLFLFDYGDLWRFTVQLVRFGTVEPKRKYPGF